MRQKIGILLCLLILTACGGQNETEYPEEAKGEESRWSEWSEALPLDIRDNKEYQIETMTRYRSRSLTTLESERELKESDGYILKDEISEWSEWSEWSRQKVTATPDREVERREAQSSDVYDSSKKQYRYSRWTQFSNGSGWSGPTQGVWSGIECDYYQETEWLDEPLEKDSEQTDSNGDVYILFLGITKRLAAESRQMRERWSNTITVVIQSSPMEKGGLALLKDIGLEFIVAIIRRKDGVTSLSLY